MDATKPFGRFANKLFFKQGKNSDDMMQKAEENDEDMEEDSFLFRRKRTNGAATTSKRAKPLQQQQAPKYANFNPFASVEPPSFISLDSSFAYNEPPSILSHDASFDSSPSFLREDGDMSCDDDDKQEEEEEDMSTFKLRRRFSSTMSFDDEGGCGTPVHTLHQQLTPKLGGGAGGGEVQFFATGPLTPQKNAHASFLSDTPHRAAPPTAARAKVLHHAHQVPVSRFESEFETLGQLGSGGFGKVFKVKNRLDGCLYAVKMVKQEVQGKTGRERVLKEVYALAALVNNSDNLHVVRYFSSWIDIDDRLYIQTELCDTSLEQMLKLGMTAEFRVQPTAVDIFKQLLQGLKGLHLSNVVHLDIKPGNILVRAGTYKLGDLGHAALSSFDALPAPPPFPNSQTEAIIAVARDFREGDSRYMARELLNEDHTHLPKADIFSLAMSVYEMFLTKVQRKIPDSGEEWGAIRSPGFCFAEDIASQMSSDFKRLMLLMLHCEPSMRPTAEALLVTGGPGHLLCDVPAAAATVAAAAMAPGGSCNGNGFYQTNDLPEERKKVISGGVRGPSGQMFKRSNTM